MAVRDTAKLPCAARPQRGAARPPRVTCSTSSTLHRAASRHPGGRRVGETPQLGQPQSQVHWGKRVDLARKPSRLTKFLSDYHTGPECSREPVRVFPPSDERIFRMISGTESPPSHDTAELRQKQLTQRLGVMPVRRSKASNLKWSTWKKRLGMRGEATPR